jgi:N6-adenosine-specific RNA methylase IME4
MEVVDFDIAGIQVEKRQERPTGDLGGLIASIKDVGLLHPIVIGSDGKLKAGYRRLMAFQKMGESTIPAHVTDELDDLLDALRAERDENVQREELPPSVMVERARELHELEKTAAQERQARIHTGGGDVMNIASSENFSELANSYGNTRDKVAAAFGVSGPTYERARQVVEAAQQDPETFGDLPQVMDDASINKAYRAMKQRTKQDPPPLPDDQYRVWYADPPWKYGNKGLDDYGHAERHYPTMSIDELCAMGTDVKDRCAPDAVLFLWVTSPLLAECFAVIEAWGFKYKTSFVWDKIKHNFGHYNSVRHEFLLICTRGSCTPDVNKLFDSVQSIEKTSKHSEKPEQFREIIDTLYPHGKRIELFARTQVERWDSWGNEPEVS